MLLRPNKLECRFVEAFYALSYFLGKAGVDPSGVPYGQRVTSFCLGWMLNAMDERTSLFCHRVSSGEKKFANTESSFQAFRSSARVTSFLRFFHRGVSSAIDNALPPIGVK
jgi:hypothetical protein